MARARSAIAVISVLACGGLTTAAAPAATIGVDGTRILITSGAESENFYAEVDETQLVFGRNAAAPALQPGTGCTGDADEVRCPLRAAILAELGGGDDQADFTGVGTTTVEAHGGDGNDGLSGGASADQLFGEGDTDWLNGIDGNDTLDGGAGNDTFTRIIGADVVSGGPGGDTLELSGSPTGFTVSLDDLANDGPPGAQTSNVHGDVEDILGTPFGDRLVGNAGENELIGGGGDDELVAGGGPFNALRGGDGNDTLDSVNEAADEVDCGAGADRLTADPRDAPVACETVTVVGPDADGDGSKVPLDCNDSNPSVRPGATDVPGNGVDEDCSGADAPLLDADRDGVTDEKDCDDGNPAIRPGAPDKPGDGIDQDCDGADDPFPTVTGTMTVFFASNGSRVRITLLRITGAQAGARAQIRCRGRGCPFTRRTLRLVRGRVVGTRLLRRARLRPGAVFELRLTAPDTVGRVRRLTVRRGGKVRAQSLCLRPGSSRARAC